MTDTDDGTGVDTSVGEDSGDDGESAADAAEGESGEGGLADWQVQALIAAALAGAAVMGWTWWQHHATPEQYQQIQNAVNTHEAQQEFEQMSNELDDQLTDEVQKTAIDVKYDEMFGEHPDVTPSQEPSESSESPSVQDVVDQANENLGQDYEDLFESVQDGTFDYEQHQDQQEFFQDSMEATETFVDDGVGSAQGSTALPTKGLTKVIHQIGEWWNSVWSKPKP